MSHLYKRKGTDSWYIKYYQDGRPHHKSLRTKSKRRAEAIQREIDRRLDNGIIAIPEKGKEIDVGAFWDRYLQWANDHKRPNTVNTETIFWKQLIGATKIRNLGELTPAKVETFKKRRLKDGLSKQSINDALKALQAIYNHARKLGLYDGPNPFTQVERYAIPKTPPKHLNAVQVGELLEAAADDGRDALMVFSLGLLAGMRKSEIDSARWEWFDFGAKLITIQSDERFVIKDKDARTIPLSNDLAAILEPYRQENGYLLKPEQNNEGQRYRYDFRKLFRRVSNQAGLPWVTPHVLRHTFGSILADRNVSIYKIQKWMGHSDVRTTQIYAHLQEYDDDINRLTSSPAENGTGNGSR